MEEIFHVIDIIVAIIGPISDFCWEFPTNFEWYSSIPVLGEFSFSTILLVGSGIYFTFRLSGIQVRMFKKGLYILAHSQQKEMGISPLAAFLLSSGIRVGPGNIMGVTGAIAAGGPGALFWMWVSAFFGMATAYTESTLAQIFKERQDNEYVGGLPYYAKTLCNNKIWVGAIASAAYIMYSMCGIPKACEFMVPIMAGIYFLTVIALILYNSGSIGYFFNAVFSGAFTPQAMFGGAFGITLVQGVKRGLMSNEAGQGTITMAAGAAHAKHPCEQGLVGAVGVFLDTHVICTLTAFIIIMAHQWVQNPEVWQETETYNRFLMSVSSMTPGGIETIILFLLSMCFALFAYTCVIGMVAFTEVSARQISSNKIFVNIVRIFCISVSAFGILSSIAGYDLDRIWAFEDLGNITIVYVNILMLHIGFKYVKKATAHFRGGAETFTSDVIGIDTPCWNKETDK